MTVRGPQAPAPSLSASNRVTGGTAETIVQAGIISGDMVFQAPAEIPPPPLPRQLLHMPSSFVNREKILAELQRAIEEPPVEHATRVIVLCGPGGIGTTTTANRLLLQHQSRFPGGQLYLDMRGYEPEGPRDLGDALGQLIRAFRPGGPLPAQIEELTALWRSISAHQPPIALLLDHAVSAPDVQTLLPGGSEHVVLATSRHPLPGLHAEGADHHRLGPLPLDAAHAYLARRLGADRLRSDAGDVEALLRLAGGLPGALVLAVAQILQHPERSVASVVQALESHGVGAASRASALSHDGAIAIMTSHSDTTYENLPNDVAWAVRRLSLLPLRDLDCGLVAEVCEMAPAQAKALLAGLDGGLLVRSGQHPLRGALYTFASTDVRATVAMHARLQVTSGEEYEGLGRALGWYLDAADKADGLITENHAITDRDRPYTPAHPVTFEDRAQALDWLCRQADNLFSLVRAAFSTGRYLYCWRLFWAMWPYWRATRVYGAWIELNVLALEAIAHCADPHYEWRLRSMLGVAQRGTGDLSAAISTFEQVRDMALCLKLDLGLAQACHELGVCYVEVDRPLQAQFLLLHAWRLRQKAGYHRGVALTELQMGILAVDESELELAGLHFREARETLWATKEFHDAARALAWEGRRLTLSGDVQAAQRHLLAAREEFASPAVNAPQWVAHADEWLGQAAETGQRPEQAVDLYERSLASYRSVGTQADINRVRGHLERLA